MSRAKHSQRDWKRAIRVTVHVRTMIGEMLFVYQIELAKPTWWRHKEKAACAALKCAASQRGVSIVSPSLLTAADNIRIFLECQRRRLTMPDQRMYPAFAESRLPHVGTYRRVLPISIERMYENTLDWAHLPYVHSTSFAESNVKPKVRGVGARARRRAMERRSCWNCAGSRMPPLDHTHARRTKRGQREVWTHAFALPSVARTS